MTQSLGLVRPTSGHKWLRSGDWEVFTNDRKETTFCILVGQTGVQTLTQVDRLNELQKTVQRTLPRDVLAAPTNGGRHGRL